MKRTFLLSFALSFIAISAMATGNAFEILDRAAAKFTSSPSISAAYNITASGNKFSGRISFCGDRFSMTSPQILTWYDGKTQWSFNKEDNEVTVTEPTPDELSQINPFVIINSFRNDFDAKTMTAPKGFVKLQLKAKSPKNEVQSAVITLNEKTTMPTQIQLDTKSKQQITIILNSVTTGPAYNIKAFQFYAPNYPGVKIVDLR
ncbi:MAG: outer-membrane lipoprotein carrier protein LolA [Paramuribaculum sp.]|nr:outer-membrane lipoprotein carrier protein LolA [Paramuribaculum sp.]MDE6488100.1 outer-membrane lipoprotein carrier protein LolA [Paramuribaculum sp.]